MVTTFSSTGNTEKVARKIGETVQELGYPVDTIKIRLKALSLNILDYDFVFVGSGVGEYKTEKLKSHSVGGRLGDIRGRPNQADLEEVAEKVKGVLSSIE